MEVKKLLKQAKFMFFFIVFLGVGIIVSFLFQNESLRTPVGIAATSTNALYGYAWSSNIGWISFNRCDESGVCRPGADYDVRIINQGSDYFLEGYAWAPNLGWIKFYGTNASSDPTFNPPSAPAEPVKIDPSSYQLSGWARACPKRNFDDDWNTSCAILGDSMGWIKFLGGTASVSLDISTSPAEFLGYAWGGSGSSDSDSNAVIGWISFNCRNRGTCSEFPYKVYTYFSFNNPPSIDNFDVEPPSDESLCNAARPGGVPASLSLVWSFIDPGDTQSRYQISIENITSGATYSYDITGSGSSFTFLLGDVENFVAQRLKYGEDYRTTLTVWDSEGAPSSPAVLDFTTPSKYPNISFTVSSLRTILGRPLTFTNTSDSSDTLSCIWEMGDGYSTTTNCNPNDAFQYTYTTLGNKVVVLTGTDSVGTCIASTTIQTIRSPGGYREVP